MGTSASTLKSFAAGEVGPTSRVLDDVLYAVFAFVAQMEPIRGIRLSSQEHNRTSRPSYHNRLGWMRLSLVCRRWRAVLITAVPLWADVAFDLPSEAASLALSRAGQLGFNMFIPPSGVSFPRLWHRTIATTRFTSTLVVLKGRDLPLRHAHRERLVKSTITHAARIRSFEAANLSPQRYRDISRCGTFDSLRVLVLHHGTYAKSSSSSRNDLGQLSLSAPNVHTAHLSAGLPLARDVGRIGWAEGGLALRLPALRELSVSMSPYYRDDLHWIVPIIKGAPGLETIRIQGSWTMNVLNWPKVFEYQPIRLETLRAVDFDVSPSACLHQSYLRSALGGSLHRSHSS